jgi:transposase
VLDRLANTPRKKVDPQKLASQAGRALQRENAHKYFDYRVEESGTLEWNRKETVIADEARLDGLYLLQTNLTAHDGDKEKVLAHYKQLIEVETAFRELKNYLEVRRVYHYRVDRVRNHVRICFLAYWLSARLAADWKANGESRRVPEILRTLQQIRLGSLSLGGKPVAHHLTQIPSALNQSLRRLNLLPLFSKPPGWAKL